jgi:hypothetical protein
MVDVACMTAHLGGVLTLDRAAESFPPFCIYILGFFLELIVVLLLIYSDQDCLFLVLSLLHTSLFLDEHQAIRQTGEGNYFQEFLLIVGFTPFLDPLLHVGSPSNTRRLCPP